MKITSVILAAGQGTRMKSDLPKVLHPVCGKPMVWHALQAARAVSEETPVMIIGHGADQVRFVELVQRFLNFFTSPSHTSGGA